MKTFNICFLLLTLITLLFSNIFAKEIDITRPLLNRELLYTRFKQVTMDLSDIKRKSANKLWVASATKQNPRYIKNVYMQARKIFKNKDIINLMAQYYYVEDLENFKSIIEFYFHSYAVFIDELSKEPLLEKNNRYRASAQSLLKKGAYDSVAELRYCLDQNTAPSPRGKELNGLLTVLSNCATSSINPILGEMRNFVRELLNDKKYLGPAFAKSYTGYIEGNKVEQLTQNPYDAPFIRYLAQLDGIIKSSPMKYSRMTVDDFYNLFEKKEDALTKVFSERGFPNDLTMNTASSHRVYDSALPNSSVQNIFGNIFSSISKAKESIFIDVFFLGGSMGVYLAKKLIAKTIENPKLKIFIVTDVDNSLGYDIELNIAFNYLRGYAEKFPNSGITMLPANIYTKRTSLPDFIDLLVDDENLTKIMDEPALKIFASKMTSYPKAKSDHSKVIVVDGKNSKTGIAYVGSKNFTDSSGAIAYDEVTMVQGPAVKIILDSHYYDLVEAFKRDYEETFAEMPETPAMGSSKTISYLETLYNLTENAPQTSNVDHMIAKVLEPLDVMGRTRTNYLKSTQVTSVIQGNTVLQIGQNNVYGTIRSVLEQNLYAILNAKKQIIISDQFLFEPSIISAIRSVVRKKYSDVKVYIILTPLNDPTDPNKPFAHIPNNLFLEDLMALGKSKIQIKWKKVPRDEVRALKYAQKQSSSNFSPEYHLKSISVDGVSYEDRDMCGYKNSRSRYLAITPIIEKNLSQYINPSPILISGSANKDNMTMLGGFRELQLMIYDKVSSVRHDCLFWSRWDNIEESELVTDPYDFIIPRSLEEKGITQKDLIKALKHILISGYNFREEVF